MTFDLVDFARELAALSAPDELMDCAARAAASISAQPTFVVHAVPGRPWDQAVILSARASPTSTPAAVRSALFAVHRKLSLTPVTLRMERSPDTQSIFDGLLPNGPASLVVVPLLSRRRRLLGALVTGQPEASAADYLANLESMASLTSPALAVALQHASARHDQERLQLFSETAEESFWDWNLVTQEMWWGGNLEQLFGGRARMSKRSDWRRTRIHADDVGRVIASFERAIQGSESSWSSEYRLRGAEEHDVTYVREHVYFLREVDGCAYRAIGTVRDVTSLQLLLQREQQARASAERASAVKDEFLAMLGHELRNPLAPIVSVLALLERKASGPDPHLDVLRRQTKHLVRMVDDLLDVSRISSGKIDLDRQRTLVEPLVQRALEMVQPLYEERRHQVEVSVSPSLALEVDSARMTQVLSNLLTNAAKYTEPGGRVIVSAAIEGGMAVIRIRDNGIGMAPEFLPNIFEMFAQEPQALNRARGGLGLGLAIVQNIVKLHGGTVEAHSEGPGRGTEVTVRLPLPGAGTAGKPDTAADTPLDIAGRDILVIDDNHDAAALLKTLLSLNGHAVRIAHHPHDALKLLAERCPDVALVDIGLPDMDGYELVGQMRAHASSSNGTKFVALTGYGLPADKLKARDAGFDAHLVKPVSPDHLEQLIDRLTARAT